MATKVSVTKNELLEAIRQYGKAREKRPPGEGWFTLDELAALEGVDRGAIRYRLGLAKKNGVQIETAPGTALDAEGRAKKAMYWRIAP